MNFSNLKKRKGTFYITRELVEDNPKLVLMIMSNCIVVRCENLYIRDTFKYHALSMLFNELAEGVEAPVYVFEKKGYRGLIAISQNDFPNHEF